MVPEHSFPHLLSVSYSHIESGYSLRIHAPLPNSNIQNLQKVRDPNAIPHVTQVVLTPIHLSPGDLESYGDLQKRLQVALARQPVCTCLTRALISWFGNHALMATLASQQIPQLPLTLWVQNWTVTFTRWKGYFLKQFTQFRTQGKPPLCDARGSSRRLRHIQNRCKQVVAQARPAVFFCKSL